MTTPLLDIRDLRLGVSLGRSASAEEQDPEPSGVRGDAARSTNGQRVRRVTGPVLWRNPALKVSASFGADRDVVVTSSPEFSGGSIGASDLGNLNSREVQRGQERTGL